VLLLLGCNGAHGRWVVNWLTGGCCFTSPPSGHA
jgi:hypothetical protein